MQVDAIAIKLFNAAGILLDLQAAHIGRNVLHDAFFGETFANLVQHPFVQFLKVESVGLAPAIKARQPELMG